MFSSCLIRTLRENCTSFLNEENCPYNVVWEMHDEVCVDEKSVGEALGVADRPSQNSDDIPGMPSENTRREREREKEKESLCATFHSRPLNGRTGCFKVRTYMHA